MFVVVICVYMTLHDWGNIILTTQNDPRIGQDSASKIHQVALNESIC